jgi:hypothetical protein
LTAEKLIIGTGLSLSALYNYFPARLKLDNLVYSSKAEKFSIHLTTSLEGISLQTDFGMIQFFVWCIPQP